MTKPQITTHAKVLRSGETHWEETGVTVEPQAQSVGAEGLADFSKTRTSAADACIYCGSTDTDRTREHIIAYALGGTVTIPRGSCRTCQRITHKFETSVLRGPMQMVRFIQDLPSRTKHEDVPESVEMLVTIDGEERTVEVPRDEAPILLAFPTFEQPSYLEGTERPVKMLGVVTGSYGHDLAETAKRLGATSIRISSSGYEPVAFAQMVAKTAFANAYANHQILRLENPGELVEAMLHKPDAIGKFVGTMPEPYLKREGVGHYLGLHELQEPRVLYSTVQFFASSGAPTYIVVLGLLR